MDPLRLCIWLLGAALVGAGVALYVAGYRISGGIGMGVGAAVLVTSLFAARSGGGVRSEPTSIEHLAEARRNELIRGTSMHLRNMKYRYSIRYDRLAARTPFTAEVNTVILGFVPVIILDNASDKQGEGFVAFPYDGRRWRGPGLPCPGDRGDALAHAARCVAPLEEG